MSEFVDIVLTAMLVENLALVFLLGMCTYLAVSKRVETAIGLGVAVIAVQTLTVPLNNGIDQLLLAPGALGWAGLPAVDLSFMRLVTFIGVIAATVQILDVVLDRYAPALQQSLGIYLPLLTVNCAILGGTLFMIERNYDFGQSMVFAAGSSIGWALAVIGLAGIREKLKYSDVPLGLQGLGITFIITGLMSLSFMGFSGIRL